MLRGLLQDIDVLWIGDPHHEEFRRGRKVWQQRDLRSRTLYRALQEIDERKLFLSQLLW